METEAKRNVTLTLPQTLLQTLKVHAAQQGTSMSKVIEEALRDRLERKAQLSQPTIDLLELLKHPEDLGLNDEIPWQRQDIYER